MIFMLQHLKKSLLQSNFDVLLVGFSFGSVFRVKRLCLVCFEVHLDGIHSVDAVLVPGGLLVEDRAQLLAHSFALFEVLDEISDHEFFVEDKNREVKLAILVDSDVRVDNLGQLVTLLSDLDTFAAECTVHFQHFVFFALVDQLDLSHGLHLQGQLLRALILQLEKFSICGADLYQPLLDVLHAFGVFLDEEARTRQNIPTLLVSVLPLVSLETVVLGFSVLSSQGIGLGSSDVQIKFDRSIATLRIQSLFEAVKSLLEVFLFVLRLFQQKIAKVIVSMVLEILGNIGGCTFERHILQRLELGFLEHGRSDLRAVERMLDPLLQVGIDFFF